MIAEIKIEKRYAIFKDITIFYIDNRRLEYNILKEGGIILKEGDEIKDFKNKCVFELYKLKIKTEKLLENFKNELDKKRRI